VNIPADSEELPLPMGEPTNRPHPDSPEGQLSLALSGVIHYLESIQAQVAAGLYSLDVALIDIDCLHYEHGLDAFGVLSAYVEDVAQENVKRAGSSS